jgi:hypothetical protein
MGKCLVTKSDTIIENQLRFTNIELGITSAIKHHNPW